jgi:hypothetical protein
MFCGLPPVGELDRGVKDGRIISFGPLRAGNRFKRRVAEDAERRGVKTTRVPQPAHDDGTLRERNANERLLNGKKQNWPAAQGLLTSLIGAAAHGYATWLSFGIFSLRCPTIRRNRTVPPASTTSSVDERVAAALIAIENVRALWAAADS